MTHVPAGSEKHSIVKLTNTFLRLFDVSDPTSADMAKLKQRLNERIGITVVSSSDKTASEVSPHQKIDQQPRFVSTKAPRRQTSPPSLRKPSDEQRKIVKDTLVAGPDPDVLDVITGSCHTY